MRVTIGLVVLLLLAAVPQVLLAQDAEPDSLTLDKLLVDSPPPETPAAHGLSAAGDNVLQPSNMKEAVASLGSYVNADGEIIGSGAYEFSFINPENVTLGDWQKWKTRFLSNLRFSLAAETPANDSSSAKAGLGFSMMLIDKSDEDIDDQFQRARLRILQQRVDMADPFADSDTTGRQIVLGSLSIDPAEFETLIPGYAGEDVELDELRHQIAAAKILIQQRNAGTNTATVADTLAGLDIFYLNAVTYDSTMTALRKEQRIRSWNAFKLQLAGAVTFASDDARLLNATPNTYHAWVSSQLGWGKYVRIAGSVELMYDRNLLLTGMNRGSKDDDEQRMIAGLRVAWAREEAAWYTEGTVTAADGESPVWSLAVGYEQKVADGVWYAFGVKQEFEEFDSRSFLDLANIRWGQREKRLSKNVLH